MKKEDEILQELREIKTILEHNGIIPNEEQKRNDAMTLLNGGMSIAKVAKYCGVSRMTVYRWRFKY